MTKEEQNTGVSLPFIDMLCEERFGQNLITVRKIRIQVESGRSDADEDDEDENDGGGINQMWMK